ncbi:hypothetical protein MUP79_07655, partial [Candidatus Bathyarchaeota archaeon]|nr:hypothetical protein [Candidatus Bathyarchaeota archaeon]
ETLGSWSEQPMVFVAASHQTSGHEYNYNNETDKITFTSGHYPATGANIRAFYKVGDSNADVPGTGVEPCSPFTNAEWAFEMDEAADMFRACTVFGVTDRNDADDTDHGLIVNESPHTGVLDAEVKYYLNETFNPFDLYDAVHKQESRWLYLNSSLTAATSYITLTEGLDDDIYQPNGYTERVLTASQTWTGYNYTALDGATFDWVNNFEDVVPSSSHSKNWMAYLNASTTSDEAMLKVTPTGFGVNITGALNFSSIVDFGFWYYSLPGSMQGPHIEFELYNNDGTKYVVLGAYANSHNAPTHPYIGTWTHYTLNNIGAFLGGGHIHNADKAFMTRYVPAAVSDDLGNPILDYAGVQHSWEWFQERLGSFKVGSVGVSMRYDAGPASKCYVDDLSVAYLAKPSGIRYERVYNMEEDKLIPSDWDAYCSFAERVLINGTLIKRHDYANRTAYESDYMIDFETGNITFYHGSSTVPYHAWDLGIGTHVKVLYSTIEENEKGRYEWMVVGKDAAAIDSIGAAYMTEAFDSRKDIEVLLTGLDINDTANGPHAPFVMGGAATGTKADYRDSLGRPHLRDDWCTTYPVSSSNMLFSGGPRAQMGTEYFNEFTSAFFARSEYVVNDTGQANKIMALTCWNRTTFGAGYAVISVYKDLNGTIGFLIWGYDGQDTYYATQWFWSIPDGLEAPDDIIVYSGIEYLQHENRGVTDIILEIDYTTCPCSVSVTTERLGTISEKAQHDP